MNALKRTPVLWGMFLANILVGIGFGLLSGQVGGAYLDTLSDPAAAQALLAGLSPDQATAHLWITLTLDTLFPITYVSLFAGLVLRFFRRWSRFAILPAFFAGFTDLTENMVQVLALSGMANALDQKAWLTPLKFGLFQVAAVLAFAALAIGVYDKFFARR